MRGEVRMRGVMHGMPLPNRRPRWVRARQGRGAVVVVTHGGMDEVGGDKIR